jgi:hypothetical protein
MFASKSPRVRSIIATVAVAASAAWLAPFLFYVFTMPVAPLPPMTGWAGLGTPIYAGLDVILLVPRVLAILFAVTVLAGSLFRVLRLRHVVFYGAAGALIGFGLSRVAPLMVGDLGSIIFAQELASLNEPLVIAGVLLAGAADGAIFWFVARQFTDAVR